MLVVPPLVSRATIFIAFVFTLWEGYLGQVESFVVSPLECTSTTIHRYHGIRCGRGNNRMGYGTIMKDCGVSSKSWLYPASSSIQRRMTSKRNDSSSSSSSSLEDTNGQVRDLSEDGFGVFLPVADMVNSMTGGWGLSYADLYPERPSTPAGIAFLSTNIAYAVSGLALGFSGDYLLGSLTEVAGAVSFWYHYAQLEYGKEQSEVRLALFTDYITAGTALIVGLFYCAQMELSDLLQIPTEIIVSALGSLFFLSLSWVWEYGKPYIFWHSLWHILSAYTAYQVGTSHLLLSS